jgi:hypothetical protein
MAYPLQICGRRRQGQTEQKRCDHQQKPASHGITLALCSNLCQPHCHLARLTINPSSHLTLATGSFSLVPWFLRSDGPISQCFLGF